MKQSIFLTLASLFFVFLNAGAAVIYVDTDATGSNNGSSWNNAYTDLQSALAVAGSNDEIWVAAGVYKPTSGVDRDIAFEIPSGVELYGGFVGTETTRSQRNWGVNASILSGAIGSGDATDNSRRIVLVENALQTVIVDGFHIRKAYNEDPGSEESPIYVRESLVEIRHCQIYDNTAEDACAVQVLYSVQSTVPDVLLDNCLIYDNTSTGASGSIVDCAAYEGHVEIRGCTFTQNDLPGIYSGIFSGQQTGGVNPGALYTMFNSIVWDNDYTDDFFSAESMVAYYNILQEELPLIGVSGGLNLTIDNLVLDPMFIAPGANDFALHLASPAINSGDNTYNTLTYDVAKNNRVFESTVDRGCYENQLGGVIYVDVDAGGADNGTSWANAFNDLQDALAIAAAGSDIWVAEGYYYPTGGSNRDISFIIPDGVALYGGFDGTETQRSQRNWDFNVTRLSGNIGNLASQTDNTKQLVVIQNAAANGVIVDGFTIQDAYNGSAGGALYINNSVAEIVHCDIKDNRANLGPALQCLLSDVTVDNCLIRSNTVVDDGGIINGFTQPNEIHVLACTITNNDMTSASGRAVGGTSGTPIEIFNSIIWDNDNNGLGSGPSFTVANCIIEGGYAGTNVLNADPLFIAPPADYTPALNSPARNAGDNTLGVLSKDFYHNNRQFDDIVDIGCVESQDDGIIYVDADATGSNSGDSWVNAYTSLTTALNNAGEGNEIWVATGTYKPTTTTDRNLKFTIPAGVELYGGFGGFETERNQRDWGLFPTIISGAIGGAGETDNSKQLFYTANAEGVVIDGFDIRKAYNDAGGGAALVLSNGSARIKHCIIHDNYAQSGVAFSGGFVNENIYFEDCLIYDNTSANGDVMVLGATNTKAKLTNCTVASNIATGGNVFGGFTSITYTIHNSIVWNHSVDVFQFGTTVHVASCIIEESDPADYASSSDILSSNPKFTNAGTDDYTLKLGSPAHNAGDNALVATNSDLGANPRIYENTVDMGCFENQTPSVYYVDVDATGLNNGTSWVNAYTDLHEALNNAVEGQQIWVAEGIYFTSYFNDQTASFVLSHNVPVYGGFAGSETSVDERDWFANATELSGNIGSVFLSSDNAWHVIFADDPTGSFYIDGFAIRGGRADGAGVHEDIGAGVLIEFSTGTFTMNNCFLYNNVADYTGGGVTAFCSSFINNTTFYQNEAHIGGAVDWSEGLYMENCLFSENIANIGIVNHNSGGTLDMRGCTFNANSVNWSSYTIVEGGNGTVANTIIWGNTTLDANIRAVQGVDDVHHSILQGAALTAGVEGEGVLYEDPHFENAPLNLNLQYNSPAINAGDISLVTLSTDVGGGPRVKLGYVDIGALESDGIVPGVIYVDDSATGNNDGTSWANAYTSLKTAIAASDPSLQIWVAEGLYKPTTTTDRNQSFVIGEGVNLMGGFAGTETDPGQRNITAHPSILSGGIGGAGVEDNSLKVVYITDVLEPVLIDGFEITEAYGSAAEPVAMALGVDDSQVDVYNCRIYNNSARAYPALYVCNSVVNFNNCLIHDNSTSASDGIAYKSVINLACSSSVLELNNCTVTGNTIPGSSASAISVNAVTNQLIVTNSIIWGNGVPMVDDPNALTILDYCIAEGMTGTHLIDVDPDFVDEANGDFHIQPWSAAVNTGLNSYVGVSTDLDGMERIQGGLVDLGCYEASSCSQQNDDCTGAVFLPDEVAVPGSTKCASGGDSPSNPCATVTGNSVWYTFTGPESGEASLHVDYVGTFTTNFNPRLAVYTGTCGATTYVTCSNSNGAGFGEHIDLVGLVAEAQYFVRVDAPVGQAGLFELTLDINDECTGDLDGNGAINVADLLIFNAAFGCTSGCGAADLDGNGVVNTADLLIFNALFGTLCP